MYTSCSSLSLSLSPLSSPLSCARRCRCLCPSSCLTSPRTMSSADLLSGGRQPDWTTAEHLTGVRRLQPHCHDRQQLQGFLFLSSAPPHLGASGPLPPYTGRPCRRPSWRSSLTAAWSLAPTRGRPPGEQERNGGAGSARPGCAVVFRGREAGGCVCVRVCVCMCVCVLGRGCMF